jgi:acetyl-CoA carboxylase biotin carboxyl carrier protein
MPLSDQDVREILRIIDESDLSELRLETQGFSLHVVKGSRDAAASGLPGGRRSAAASDADRGRGQAEAAAPAPSDDMPAPPERAEAPGGSSAGLGEPSEPSDELTTIPAPMLGTFYRAEAPGKPPFVEVGSKVEPDTIVCIIEVMKMMNSVPAGVSGTVAEVLADNAKLVEYGEPLFRVEPA